MKAVAVSLMRSARVCARLPTARMAVNTAGFATSTIFKPQLLDFAGTKENVFRRADIPKEKIQQLVGNETLAMLGYGSQGRGQALNAKDNGLKVIVGLREGGSSWDAALKDGWKPGETLFSLEEAARRGSVIMYLLSDAGQKEFWPTLRPTLTKGKTLYFAHGFSVIFAKETGVRVDDLDVDVVLVAPKGSGTTVRSLFQEGRGINASVAVYQDKSGKAMDKTLSLAAAVGAGYMYETTFHKEVVSDLTGERGVLMGAIQGLFAAQYQVLRAHGHSPSEAFNETVEEATQSLYPLIGKNGMDWMYDNCSTTARRGALDWWKSFRDASLPVFEKLYNAVESGAEAKRTLDMNSRPNYRELLEKDLKEIRDSELWRVGKVVRTLRPENQ